MVSWVMFDNKRELLLMVQWTRLFPNLTNADNTTRFLLYRFIIKWL
jgi:hypothetical protein